MPLTPVEIRHQQLRRSFPRGYRRADVDRLLNEIADSFEDVWRERADLADRLEELEAAQEMKTQARRESDLIVQEAHAEGRRVAREAMAEKRRLEDDVRRIRAQLRTALEALGEPPPEAREEGAAPEEKPAGAEEPTESAIRKVVG